MIYCLIGPNTGLLGKKIPDFLYLISWLIGIPLILVFAIPFFWLMLLNLDKFTSSISLNAREIFSIKERMYISFFATIFGTLFFVVLGVTALINHYQKSKRILDLEAFYSDMSVGFIFAGVVIVFTVFIITYSIINSITTSFKFANIISQGDLTVPRIIKTSNDELGILVYSLNKLLLNFKKILKNVSTTSAILLKTSNEQNLLASNISTQANEEASSLEQLSASIEELNVEIYRKYSRW